MPVTVEMRRRVAGAAQRLWATRRGRAGSALAAVGLVAVAALWLGGGLRPAPVEEARVTAGEHVELGPVRAAVIDHTVTDEILDYELEDAGGEAWLVVRAELEVVQAESLLEVPDLVALPDDVGLAVDDDFLYPITILASDGTLRPQLHPGLPEEVLIAWPLSSADAVPEPLEVQVLGAERYFSRLQHGLWWTDEEPVAVAEVPRGADLPRAVLERLREDD